MMRNSILFIFLVTLYSCEEQPCHHDIFKGLTSTDYDGSALSAADPDDWTFTDHWDNDIMDLFDSDHDANCEPSFNYSIIAYPNPCNGLFDLHFDKDSSTTVDIRIRNDECDILANIDGVTSNTIQIQSQNNSPQKIVRLYYKFIRNNCEYQGHGDIYFE
ncbi:MAG: hypothetical protein WBP41_04515 [Saprospiraceae bacterium]